MAFEETGELDGGRAFRRKVYAALAALAVLAIAFTAARGQRGPGGEANRIDSPRALHFTESETASTAEPAAGDGTAAPAETVATKDFGLTDRDPTDLARMPFGSWSGNPGDWDPVTESGGETADGGSGSVGGESARWPGGGAGGSRSSRGGGSGIAGNVPAGGPAASGRKARRTPGRVDTPDSQLAERGGKTGPALTARGDAQNANPAVKTRRPLVGPPPPDDPLDILMLDGLGYEFPGEPGLGSFSLSQDVSPQPPPSVPEPASIALLAGTALAWLSRHRLPLRNRISRKSSA